MAKIAAMCEDLTMEVEYLKKADCLAKAINNHMWDPVDEMYYHLDMLSSKPPLASQDVFWDIPLKFKTWTSFMPMYAGIAPEKYAEKLVKKHMLNRNEFWSDYGLRSLAQNESVYNVVESSNPSNWQGPIWIVSTYLMFKGLLNYGYVEEAEQVAKNLLGTLCRDLDENGALHEYYNPETGISNINLGFQNWNALAGVMVPELIAYRSQQTDKI
jgi:putative isomerase